MEDRYGRTIEYLRLSVTDRCNLRCRYCMPEEGIASLGHGDILSYEELVRLAAAAVALGVRKIRVTGGEPLVRKGLAGFIRQLAALPGAPEIVLTTNGLLLSGQAEELKAAGLARVNVSLDTLRADRFVAITRRDGLEAVLAGLARAEAVGLTPLKINMVPLRGINDDEIPAFAELARQAHWEVRFIEYMPTGGLDYAADAVVPAEAILTQLERLAPLAPLAPEKSSGPARLFRLTGYQGTIGVIPAVSQHFCGECNRLRLTADGRLRPCLFADQELDVRTPLRAGAGQEELMHLLLGAVQDKPEGHRIGRSDFVPMQRRMHGIGG